MDHVLRYSATYGAPANPSLRRRIEQGSLSHRESALGGRRAPPQGPRPQIIQLATAVNTAGLLNFGLSMHWESVYFSERNVFEVRMATRRKGIIDRVGDFLGMAETDAPAGAASRPAKKKSASRAKKKAEPAAKKKTKSKKVAKKTAKKSKRR